jgi:hypothetical protein
VKRRLLLISGVVAVLLAVLIGGLPVAAKGFVHGIAINYDGNVYYFGGAPAGDGWDVPGHSWVQAGPDHLRGKHYNTGPGALAEQGWSSDAPDGELLYVVDAIIDTADLSPEKAAFYKARGYVHRHELVSVGIAGEPVPVPGIYAYLKHTARTSFTLDRGPAYWMGAPTIPYAHPVTPGVDYEFPNNW